MVHQKFDYIISLGFCCQVAQDLERLSYRDHAYPFDWVISDMRSINDSIECNFKDLFNVQYLYRDSDHKYIVKNRKFKFDFYHDFLEFVEIGDQIEEVEKKYSRRINHFFKILSSGKKILFIKYLNNKQTQPIELDEIYCFIKLVQKYSTSFKIMLISNTDGDWGPIKGDYILEHFMVKRNNEYINDSPLFETEIKDYFDNNIHYNSYYFFKNRLFKFKKSFISRLTNVAGMI
jgi:hypothetical protein